MRASRFCEAHPNGTILRCEACAVARAAAQPAPVAGVRARKDGPSAKELIRFESEWPDRSAKRVVDGQLVSHDEAVWNRWGLSLQDYSVRAVSVLRRRVADCAAVEPTTTGTLLQQRLRRATARAGRTLRGLS